jgi:hypothetical protein
MALFGALILHLEGALVGAAALATGVVMEAFASRLMAHGAVRTLLATNPGSAARENPITYGYIWRFYYPLALTSVMILGVNPVVTFFLGQSRMALESLAAMPVVNALVFLFGSLGLAFQEVGIALVGPAREGYLPLRRFAATLAAFASGALALVAFSPALSFWLQSVSGLSPELAGVAAVPIRILALMPALSVTISFQRAMLVAAKRTVPITWATVIEVAGIVVGLTVGIRGLNLVGATAAGWSFIAARSVAILFLTRKSTT